MVNFKNLSLGLALAGLGVVTLTPKAQAFQFFFLNQVGNDYNFEFQADTGDSVNSDETLTISNFIGVTGASLNTPETNENQVLYSDSTFDPSKITFDGTSASFSTSGSINAQRRPVRFQTFTVTATGATNGIVNPDFGGNQLPQTPVPEPLTIMGSLAALGFATRCKKEFAKKQTDNSEKV